MRNKIICTILFLTLLLTSCGTDNSCVIGKHTYYKYNSTKNKIEDDGYTTRIYVDGTVKKLLTKNDQYRVVLDNKNYEYYIDFEDEETAKLLVDENKGQMIRCYGQLLGVTELAYPLIGYESIYLSDEHRYFSSPFQSESPAPTPIPISNEKNYNNLILKDWVRWDMDIREVIDSEKRIYEKTTEDVTGRRKFLYYAPESTDYSNFDFFYMFEDDFLKAYSARYTGKAYLTRYNEVKEVMTQQYGTPMADDTTWTDETYKNDESKWEKAFEYGYLALRSAWQSGNTMIILDWDIKTRMQLLYCSVNYTNSLN